jgi:hypothetical protein
VKEKIEDATRVIRSRISRRTDKWKSNKKGETLQLKLEQHEHHQKPQALVTRTYHPPFFCHIAAFLSEGLITEMLEICIQTSYDQNVQLILKSYLPVVYGTPLMGKMWQWFVILLLPLFTMCGEPCIMIQYKGTPFLFHLKIF